MKPLTRRCILFLLATFCLCSCSTYYFPHIYDGPPQSIYMPTWANRTSKLGLDASIYRSLSSWFLKSDSINLTQDKQEANLILAGEIKSISLPSISWDGDANVTDIKVRLVARYVLQDLASGKILWEVSEKVWTKDYPASTPNAAIEDETLDDIIKDMTEEIYLGTLKKIRQRNKEAGITN